MQFIYKKQVLRPWSQRH